MIKNMFAALKKQSPDVSGKPCPNATNPLASPAVAWQSWAITHTGMRRRLNEDALLNRPDARLWVVADGMGGHQAGDVASQLIVDSLGSLHATEALENYADNVEQQLQQVNRQLRQLAVSHYGNQLIGSTVVALVCQPPQCVFLWAGDSRLYRLRNNKLKQLTQDHCEGYGQNITDWEVKNSNIITKAIGAEDTLELSIGRDEVLVGDVFLLCSDGLDKELSLHEIETIMCGQALPDIAQALLDETLGRGARDNVSVIVISQANTPV